MVILNLQELCKVPVFYENLKVANMASRPNNSGTKMHEHHKNKQQVGLLHSLYFILNVILDCYATRNGIGEQGLFPIYGIKNDIENKIYVRI